MDKKTDDGPFRSNVRAIPNKSVDAEGILRQAISVVREDRAEGRTDYVVVILGSRTERPELGITSMDIAELSLCHALLTRILSLAIEDTFGLPMGALQ